MISWEEGSIADRRSPRPALNYVAASPARPRASVVLLHGYGDHAARYGHVMETWAEMGLASLAVDFRGHGRSGGERGSCDRFEDYLDDVADAARTAERWRPGQRLFLFGHAFGGLVAASSGLNAPGPWGGVLVTSPSFGLAKPLPAPKLLFVKAASRLVPSLALPTGVRGDQSTRDPVRAKAQDEDPLVLRNARARWFVESQRAGRATTERARWLSLPLFVAFGTDDSIQSEAAARRFFEAAGSKDKTWHSCQGARHRLLDDLEWKALTKKMGEWVLAHASSSPAASS